MFERPDPELDTALELSESDPQQAARVLKIAANYLKRQEKLPSALAIFLASAFERAMNKASMFRGAELLRNLNLQVDHRKLKANFEYVGMDVEQLLKEKIPKGKAIIQVGETYGISDSTVKRMHEKYLAHRRIEEDAEAIDQEQEQLHYQQRSDEKDCR